ncbi:1,4-dihydroxy-2-naphthoate polyprenyltransferase [Caldilinea sp.]|uniref:1,4-dihydroxy-2-naphthoate polyprenyltransferase n=1 Tax=Caldilinea sp. TaxID=2293560 RepID=UPI0021DECF5F|nr:1,4-dihydroxy-2-naphthoate polyprenyltransferase [Caldilinea sp.]GIV67771.1 MAG: 1,4-dihydroxy-2-naphthoate octaprenyltransferase [Caldilinea sp.]GIV67777.1 MAG: 1,4-dihydroxy-2-naphthoate octaprenyltransferase [Caldilinea sp.]
MATQTITRRQAWILAARPKTLPAALSPVIVGTAFAFADGGFAWLPALAAALGALLLQILSNFANDYSDFFRGADTPERLGPVRVTSAGLIRPEEMRRGIIVVIGLSALVGLYLIWVGGWPILAIGVAAILAALAYTGGPFPFGYYGLGELFVFLFFGVAAVCGTYYVQTLTLTSPVLIASFAVGALVTAILVVNNYRDIETDRRAGKRTLAVRLGRRGTQIEYVALLAFAYGMVLVLWLFLGSGAWVLLTGLTLPLAAQLARTLRSSTDGPTLNRALAGTARLALLFSLLLAAGVLLE